MTRLPLRDGSSEQPGGKKPTGHTSQRSHAGSWIVTYSDMVTLLMAFFIAIISYYAKTSIGTNPPSGDSLVEGRGGEGIAGPRQEETVPKDAVLWRVRFRQGPKVDAGAEFAPVYRDPALDTTEGVLRALAVAKPDKVGDPYILRLPFGLLFGSKGKLTPSGMHILRTLAVNLRDLPYDFTFSVRATDQIPQAVQASIFTSTFGSIHPGRIGVGVRAEADDEPDTVVLMVTPQS